MKALIVGLLSLAALAACATTRTPTPPTSDEIGISAEGLPQFCRGNSAILIILINNKGDPVPKKCPKFGNKPIKHYPKLPDGVDIKVGDRVIHGWTQKWKAKGQSDPCIEWAVGGRSYYYCW